ncbi:uncharacterized protein MEPE_06449 [Melanopsichium pennsylvanicum]|uniref:Uncharacterized protein n=2 Tax=Melanopsichium pennsylvanicum TaxID=63383 RepID=A0AAJ4XSE7_9BASI|nr:putative protein [Melanopsichium pennsylvanicum 4]SNX87739.1 uncharacterized protein MEPE_06449 [Melanopsichium pennsylvanicum]
MSAPSYAESQATDAGMSRAASRTGSISTIWSSAEVPLCLDPRVHHSSDSYQAYPSRSHSIAGSISHHSARSSQTSIDFGRLSIDIPDEYPRRPDTIRLSPPRATGSASSSSGSSPSRVPSFNIGTIDEDKPMHTASPISKFAYQPPSLTAQQQVLSSRFSEDTIDEPHLSHSTSQGTFGVRLSVPRKSSGVSEISRIDLDRSSSILHTEAFVLPLQVKAVAAAQAAPTDLYRRAYRLFDKDYTLQPSLESKPTAQSFDDTLQRFDHPSLACSELYHQGSLPSCSRSQASTQASSSDSASAWSAESCMSRSLASGAAIVAGAEHLAPSSMDTTLTPKRQRNISCDKFDNLEIPSLPSLSSFNSSLTATRGDMARDLRRRPSTADVYSQPHQVSPRAFSDLQLPPPLPMVSSIDSVRYQVQSFSIAPAPSPSSKTPSTRPIEMSNNKSTTSRLLRGRVASTPKLRLDASSLFRCERGLHVEHSVPPLPTRPSGSVTDGRSSTAQMDGRAPFFGRRFRSRTLGESDRNEAANMHAAAVGVSKAMPSPISAQSQRCGLVSRSYNIGSPSTVPQRHPSQVSAASSDLPSSMYMQPTPGSSICSTTSPATTNSSLPVTPRSTTAFPRPKSRGTGCASKSGGGWASYLNSGLTLHLEADHGRTCQINMTYLAYDPFGRPEQLVQDTEEARSLTPKRPKSRGDKDSEAEQSGTLEFGPCNDRSEALDEINVTRSKSDSTSVLLKHLTIGEDTKADLLTRQAALSLNTIGTHQVSGYERRGRLAWKLAYRVVEGDSVTGVRRLIPLRFSCSATLLNPERARKSRLLNLVKKSVVPSLASKAVAAPSVDSPRSTTCSSYEDGMGTTTASPASSRRSNKQFVPECQQQPISPNRRANNAQCGGVVDGGVLGYNSPLRQTSRNAIFANSLNSADSSFCSQPTNPGRDFTSHNTIDTSRSPLQESPVSAQFGAPRHVRSIAMSSPSASATSPGLQLDLGVSKRLQEKASMASLGADSSVSSVQLAAAGSVKPMVVNGRRLIPISLPAGLARSKRIDPALLQANIVSSNTTSGGGRDQGEVGRKQRNVSMNSSPSSEPTHQHNRDQSGNHPTKRLLWNTPRTAGTGTGMSSCSRPPTASESIKLEYLARTALEGLGQPQLQQQGILRHQKSFAGYNADAEGILLTPSSFTVDVVGRQRRQRSRTMENHGKQQQQMRPFTADAWGESQYPYTDQQRRILSQQHAQPRLKTVAGRGSSSRSGGNRQFNDVGGECFEFQRDQGGEGMMKPLPVPIRSNVRPRTAQTITAVM